MFQMEKHAVADVAAAAAVAARAATPVAKDVKRGGDVGQKEQVALENVR